MESMQWFNLRLKVLVFLGGRCNGDNCRHLNEDGTMGCDDLRILQLDHVKGDGPNDRKGKSNHTLFSEVLLLTKEEATKRYQLLCPTCNWIKRYMKKEYRKQSKYYDVEVAEELLNPHVPLASLDLLNDVLKIKRDMESK